MIEANCELETERTGENQEIVGLGVGGEQSGGREVMTCEYRLDLLTNLREDYAKFYKHGEGHHFIIIMSAREHSCYVS